MIDPDDHESFDERAYYEAVAEGRKEIAKAFLAHGMSREKIKEFTGIDLEEDEDILD